VPIKKKRGWKPCTQGVSPWVGQEMLPEKKKITRRAVGKDVARPLDTARKVRTGRAAKSGRKKQQKGHSSLIELGRKKLLSPLET